MHAFFHDGELPPKLSQKATPSASFSSGTAFDSVNHLNDCTEEPDLRWTSYHGDTVEPNPWVQYDFASLVKINAIRIW
ncbi:MAG: hypothetical protein Q4F54_06300 [Coriobacteriia bacterium]|nr:hypothetical protein [Coriobacteriia bacterium]